MPPSAPRSIPHVAEVALVRGLRARADAPPDLLVEVAHGATRSEHFLELAARLRGPLPGDLQAFFHVNTDVGAPEVATALARTLVARDETRVVLVVRCLVPRTFVDTNRLIPADARGRASEAGGVTPGMMPWVKDPSDLALLHERYAAYRALVTAAVGDVCGRGHPALFVHSYAPREVDVAVDERIVERLREAYAPERVTRWPLRPEVDLITRAPDGSSPSSSHLAERIRQTFEAAGLEVAVSRSYPLHPSTMAYDHAVRHPGRTLCLEIRRDLLVEAFTPFEEMHPEPGRVARLGGLLAEAVLGASQLA